MKKNSRLDDIKLGITIGTIAPVIGVLIYYYIHQAIPHAKINGLTYQDYLDLLQRPRFLATVLRGALILNLIVFALSLKFDSSNIAQGILGMTIIYGLLIVYLHFS